MSNEQASYEVVNIDLATQTGIIPLQRPGAEITSVTVLAFPLGSVAFLKIGQMGMDVPISNGLEWETDGCEGEKTGVYVNNPSAGAGTLSVVVCSGGGRFSKGQ